MKRWMNKFERRILEKGMDYYFRDAIDELCCTEKGISANVFGSRCYAVKIQLKEGEIKNMHCTCPDAEEGNNCEHMAAALFAAERESAHAELEADIEATEEEWVSLRALLQDVPKEELIDFISKLAEEDLDVHNLVKARFASSLASEDMSLLYSQVDHIFTEHGDESGFVDWRHVGAWEMDASRFLDDTVLALVKNGLYMKAFEVALYMYEEINHLEIDDSGETAEIASECFNVFTAILQRATEKEKKIIKDKLKKTVHDMQVDDFFAEILTEYIEDQFATEDDLKIKMAELDRKIEESERTGKKNYFYKNGCARQTVLEARIELMKRLGARPAEVDAFMKSHWALDEVRDHYAEIAKEAGNLKRAIEIFEESRDLHQGKQDTVKANEYSRKLINLYHTTGQTDKEKQERIKIFPHASDLKSFVQIKQLCTKKEWKTVVSEILDCVKNEDKCPLLAEENMEDELFACIMTQSNRKQLFDRYGFMLKDRYSKEILDEYQKYAENTLLQAPGRAAYNRLLACLDIMCKYPGGKIRVAENARMWVEKYPTYKVLVKELQTYIRTD